MKKKRPTKWIVFGSIVLILVVARLLMPWAVTRYVNNVLGNMPGYRGSIYDVDISLLRGAYTIDSLKVFKVDGNKEIPFIDIPVTDLSVEWAALFDGAVVGEVGFERPVINFIGGDEKKDDGKSINQSGEGVDWTEQVKKLMPLQINRLEITEGTLVFHDFTTKPNVNISLEQLHAVATNLNNAEKQSERLPSTISATATSIGGGTMNLEMGINVLKEIPDLDMDFKFEKIDMPSLNPFFKAYAKVDVEKGKFNIYSEMTVNDGVLNGYVKPVAQNVKIVKLSEDIKNPLNLLWESFVGIVTEVFENQKEDQLATKAPLEGNLNNVNTSIWPTIWNIFRNAFVKAFERSTDNSVQFNSAPADNSKPDDTKKSKREKRKEERKQRRAERREKKSV